MCIPDRVCWLCRLERGLRKLVDSRPYQGKTFSDDDPLITNVVVSAVEIRVADELTSSLMSVFATELSRQALE